MNKHTDTITQQVSRRGTEKPLIILPEENLEEVTSRLPGDEELAARLIFRTANKDIFRLKWQDVERTGEGWNIEINDRDFLIDEEDIVQEIDKKKQDNLPLLNTTEKKLSDRLPEEIQVSHLRFGGLAYLVEEKTLRQTHQRSGYAPHTLDRYAKMFHRQEIIQLDNSVYQEEMDALSRYLKEEKEELALLSEDEDLGKPILPESGLDHLCNKFQRYSYEFATRLMFRGGLRADEAISNLSWGDIERKNDELEVELHGRTTRTVVVEGEQLLKLYRELQEDSGQVFEFCVQKYNSALHHASEGKLYAYRLRASRAYHLVNEQEASAKRLSDELGFKLSKARRRVNSSE